MRALPFFVFYLIAINLVGVFVMWDDKRRARRLAYRIPEVALFAVALLLGSAGTIAGMWLFRHKTKRLRFVVGMPLILVLQLACVIFLAQSPLTIQFL